MLPMRHRYLFLFPLTPSSALSSLAGVGVASIAFCVPSDPLLPLHDCFLQQILFPLAMKPFLHYIFHRAAEKYQKEVEGN